MTARLFGIEIRLSLWFLVVIACFLALGRERLFFYFILPIVTHELGHFLAMAVVGVSVEAVFFTPTGIRIRRKRGRLLSYGKEIAISLGGIAANLLMALVLRCFVFQSMRAMLLVSCNIAVALFHSLPVGNLDGGQALHLLCSRFCSLSTADILSRVLSFLVLTPMAAAAVLLLLREHGNFTLLVVCAYLAIVVVFRAE